MLQSPCSCKRQGGRGYHGTSAATAWDNSVAFSSDDHRILAGSNDHTVRLWNAENGKPIWITLIPFRDIDKPGSA